MNVEIVLMFNIAIELITVLILILSTYYASLLLRETKGGSSGWRYIFLAGLSVGVYGFFMIFNTLVFGKNNIYLNYLILPLVLLAASFLFLLGLRRLSDAFKGFLE